MNDLFYKSGATISDCGLYRYHLWRIWNEEAPVMVFVMQNPSTADADQDDPTIRKCVGFARREGFGGISVRNVFALRATDERELLTHQDPVGPENLNHLLKCRDVLLCSKLVVAWGVPFGGARLSHHYKAAVNCLVGLAPHCLGVTKEGHPKHPLFLAANTEIVPWRKEA